MTLLYLCASPKLKDEGPILKKRLLPIDSAPPGAAVLGSGDVLPGSCPFAGILDGLEGSSVWHDGKGGGIEGVEEEMAFS